jgi:hypothetical protein
VAGGAFRFPNECLDDPLGTIALECQEIITSSPRYRPRNGFPLSKPFKLLQGNCVKPKKVTRDVPWFSHRFELLSHNPRKALTKIAFERREVEAVRISLSGIILGLHSERIQGASSQLAEIPKSITVSFHYSSLEHL